MIEEKECKMFSHKICNKCGLCTNDTDTRFFDESYRKENIALCDEEFGIAVDMGTTTISTLVYRMKDKSFIGKCSLENPQRKYGLDVISRQTYALQGDRELRELQKILIDGINKTIQRIVFMCGIRKESIDKMVVAGNTTMSHLFLGLDLRGISASPFVPAFTGSKRINASELGIDISSEGELYIPANIGGHVGSDITAGLLNDDIFDVQHNNLYIDLGTNGEIVLTGNGKALATSVAAGPVFEGGATSMGMCASAGAITDVKIDDDVRIKTVYDAEAVGICGSGIISAVSEMIKNGILDCYGRILSKDELRKKGVREVIAEHIIQDGEVNNFLLSEKGNLVITQKDIREIQLAKAAVFSAINLLMDKIKITEQEIEKVYITGNFGNNLRTENIITIGLIPEVDITNIYYIPDGVINGLIKLGYDEKIREIESEISQKTIYISLADSAKFQEEYISAINFSM